MESLRKLFWLLPRVPGLDLNTWLPSISRSQAGNYRTVDGDDSKVTVAQGRASLGEETSEGPGGSLRGWLAWRGIRVHGGEAV